MTTQSLPDTARALVAGGKGLLAMDESNPTCDKRFAALGIPQTEEARRDYRDLIVTAPGLGEYISGAILSDETIRQAKKDATPFVKVLTDAGIVPGIKVDTGAKDLAGHPGEKATEGLDGLRDRLRAYVQMGARFAKWRAVIALGNGLPSRGCIEANAQALAQYAALCQEAGLVPVVEPEVLMDGEHTMKRCRDVTEEILRSVFGHLHLQRVMLEGMILKPNMLLPGLTCPTQELVAEVADATLQCLLQVVPRRGARRGLPVRRPIGRTGLGPPERHERPGQFGKVSRSMGVDVFVRARDPTAGFGNMAGQGCQRDAGAARPMSPCQVQLGSAPG